MVDIKVNDFSTTTFSSCDYGTFNPTNYFSDYHHFEEYNPNVEYDYLPFEIDYGKGKHTYKNEMYILADKNNINKEYDKKTFVIVKEILSNEELEELKKYCNCFYHKSDATERKNICACCYGCILAGNNYAHQDVIDEARKRRDSGVEPHLDEDYMSVISNMPINYSYLMWGLVIGVLGTIMYLL